MQLDVSKHRVESWLGVKGETLLFLEKSNGSLHNTYRTVNSAYFL